MAVRINNSKERILAAAQDIVLQKGFSATSIEDILAKASITKGGFFYHFNGRGELAHALIDRAIEIDDAIFSDLFQKADHLSEDPLQRFLIFLKLLADLMGEMEENFPGCIIASFTYESQLFDGELQEKMKQGFLGWREIITKRLESVLEKYQPAEEIDITILADMYTAIIEGGFILARAVRDNSLLVNQILAYRSYIGKIFDFNR